MNRHFGEIATDVQYATKVHVRRDNGDATLTLPYNSDTTFEYIRNFAASWVGLPTVGMATLRVDGKEVSLDRRLVDYISKDGDTDVTVFAQLPACYTDVSCDFIA